MCRQKAALVASRNDMTGGERYLSGLEFGAGKHRYKGQSDGLQQPCLLAALFFSGGGASSLRHLAALLLHTTVTVTTCNVRTINRRRNVAA
jgi:hypothetical protein